MILWFGIAIVAVALVAMLLCLFVFARRQPPNDFATLPTVLVSVLLTVQIVISIIAPFTGNHAARDPLEYWLYLIVALALPVGAGIWALVDGTRWANLVLAVVHFAVAVMVVRMMVIWLDIPIGL